MSRILLRIFKHLAIDFLVVLIILILLFGSIIGFYSSRAGRESGVEPLVLAFYYPWYHEEDWQSDKVAHTPIIGAYNSSDKEVISQHLEWAEESGIDGLIVSWWGKDSFTDQNFEAMLKVAEKENSALKFSIYYETTPGYSLWETLDEFRYILAKYGSLPSFLKVDGKPVIFIYQRAMDETSLWSSLIEKIKEEQGVVMVADVASVFSLTHYSELDRFDGFHVYNILSFWEKFPRPLAKVLNRVWVGFAKNKGKISTVNVYPGYDDIHLMRLSPKSIDRQEGGLYQKYWEIALSSRADWVLIVSFNEWYESSEIEPSQEFGKKYLELTKEYSLKFKNR